MKIIANIPAPYGGHKYIVEMTEEEIKQASCHTPGTNQFYIGSEFKVSSRYFRLLSLESNRTCLDKAIKQLRAIADILEPLESIVSGEMPVEEVKEQQ